MLRAAGEPYNRGLAANSRTTPLDAGRGWSLRMSEHDKSKSLKSTLNLPQTGFAMKANLPQSEPARLARWEAEGLYEQIRAARDGAPKYILHDGPP